VLFVVILPLLLSFVALSVDVVYAFMVKAALVTAVDASALAGSRAIVNGDAAVGAAVDRTFHSNLPDGYLVKGAPSYVRSGIITETDGSRSITVTGTAKSPSFFMGVLGYNGWDVSAFAKGGRRDINIMLVLDRSGSLVDAGAWDDVQAAANFFVGQFDDAHDKVGLVGFGSNSKLDFAPRIHFRTTAPTLLTTISNMQSRHGNATNSSLGLYLAYDALRTLNETSRENVIVFFTDGNSSAFPGQFDVRTTGSPRCTPTPRDGVFLASSGGEQVYAIMTQQPTSAPGTWPTPDYALISGCNGLNSDGLDNTDVLSGAFRATWVPSIGTAPPVPVSVLGLNPVTLSSTSNGTNVLRMSENMLLNVAQSARLDTLKIRIMVIGLGGTSTDPVDTATLQRVANVAPYTVSGQRVGLYVYAPTSTQLMSAFRQVASSVSHLVQ
jgi:hypothetical protein